MFIIDSSVGSKELADYFSPDDYILDSLTSGDVLFNGIGEGNQHIIIAAELKRIDDLVQSRESGRLQRQLRSMLREYGEVWLVSIGEYRKSPTSDALQIRRAHSNKSGNHYRQWETCTRGKSEISFGYVDSAIACVQYCGVHYQHCLTLEDVICWLKVIYAKKQQPYEQQIEMLVSSIDLSSNFNPACLTSRASKTTKFLAMPATISREEEAAVRVFAQLPGLKDKRALAALRHFGSVEMAFLASIEEWADCPVGGLTSTGKQRKLGISHARTITEFIRRRHAR